MAHNGQNRAFFESLVRKSSLDPLRTNRALTNALEINGKFSKVAISAAARSAEVSNAWTMETLARLEEASSTGRSPSEFPGAAAGLALGTLGDSTKLAAKFFEIAKDARQETLDLIFEIRKDLRTQRGKDAGAESTEADDSDKVEVQG